jgi:hypothetical protein
MGQRTVSSAEREYFRRIGAAKASSHAEARTTHLMLSIDERLQRSEELYLRHRDQAMRRQPDDPTPFYERARALGLCRE